MAKPEPDWRSTGGSGKAHLLDRTRLESKAWCGADLRSAVAAGFEERCKNCLTAVEGYLEAAQEAIPQVLTESVLIQVRRGVHQRDLFGRVCTWLASGNMRHLEIQGVLAEDPLPEEGLTRLMANATPEQQRSLQYMHNQRTRGR